MPKAVRKQKSTSQDEDGLPKRDSHCNISSILNPPRWPAQMTPQVTARFKELSAPTPTEQSCKVCGQGRGIPKTDYANHTICAVCKLMLDSAKPEARQELLDGFPDKLTLAAWRLQFFREWFQTQYCRIPRTEQAA